VSLKHAPSTSSSAANGANAWYGWRRRPEIERLRARWLDAPDAARVPPSPRA
jgi:hypothetical protein